uniref:Putative otu ovarian tumor-like cysteine protease n=1 Tax=Lutzomyia longipalpis TaxID=7200 RepID=A0A1B0GH74_LUTLO
MGDSEDNDIQARHRKERKEVQAKIQELKKAAKSDKKKKKEILEEIVRLESELEKKHSDELNTLNRERKESESTVDGDHGEHEDEPERKNRTSKAQKRREKKEKEEREREAMILAAEALNINSARQKEYLAILQLLQARQLAMHEIPSDGNCLYNAVNHQLLVTGRKAVDITRLRFMTADYILDNKDTLSLYMTNPETNNPLTDAEFTKYCESVRNTAAWGGQIEIKALSHTLKVPIEVIQAEGPPTVQGDTEFQGPNLILTYHRHMYSLGEHFNSTKTAPEQPDDPSEEN